MGVIYLRTNSINGKQYVGQATNLKERQYSWNCVSKSYAGNVIDNARKKYGVEAFDFEILKECKDDELNKWEMYYIKKLNTKTPNGYNMTDGGDGANGLSWSEESKRKQSERFKGKNHPNYGKCFSEEHKRNISKALKGRKFTEEWRRKQSESHKGKKQSEETKRKRIEKLKGKPKSEEARRKIGEANRLRMYSEETRRKISESQINGKNSKPVLQINKDTNEVIAEFPSMKEVERQLGFNSSNISGCCCNKPHYNTAYGFKWQYK